MQAIWIFIHIHNQINKFADICFSAMTSRQSFEPKTIELQASLLMVKYVLSMRFIKNALWCICSVLIFLVWLNGMIQFICFRHLLYIFILLFQWDASASYYHKYFFKFWLFISYFHICLHLFIKYQISNTWKQPAADLQLCSKRHTYQKNPLMEQASIIKIEHWRYFQTKEASESTIIFAYLFLECHVAVKIT